VPATLKLQREQIDALLRHYRHAPSPNAEPHVLTRIKREGLSVTVYKNGTVLFQGADALSDAAFFADAFNIAHPGASSTETTDYYLRSYGSDETGVGDYFGPLVVACAYVTPNDKSWLEKLGVRDSKTLSDETVKRIAPVLVERVPYSLVVLDPPSYNAQTSRGFNAHKLKAYLHAQTHKKLRSRVKAKAPIIVDQFCDAAHYARYVKDFKDAPVPDIFKTKAESHYASVAVASIIARYRFLTKLDDLGKTYGVVLPKGASKAVDDAAAQFIQDHGIDALKQVAKLHFKTTDKAKENLLSR